MTSGTAKTDVIFNNLSKTRFLVQTQINGLNGDSGTILPQDLDRPPHWPDWQEGKTIKDLNFAPDKPFVFISYSAENRKFVELVRHLLIANGINCWWDQNILPGQKWRNEIDQKLKKSSAVFILWTKASVKSDPVTEEATYAQKQGKLVHALAAEVTPPRFFGETQWADLRLWYPESEGTSFEEQNLLLGLRAKLTAHKATNLVQKAPLGGEKLSLDQTTGKVKRDTTPLDKAELYTSALKRVHDILQLAKVGNGLTKDSDIVQQLEQALIGSSGDALFVHDIFVEMREEIGKAVKDGWLPDNLQIRQLHKALDKAALDIRISQDHVAETLAARAELRLVKAEQEDLDRFHSDYPVMPEVAEEDFAEELNTDKAKFDSAELPEDASKADKLAAREEARNAGYRFANRAARMRQIAGDAGDKLTNAESVVKRLDSLVDIFTKWFGF
jgi:hypothetical protein